MLISPNIKIFRIIRETWKTDIMILFCCVSFYYLNSYYLNDAISIPTVLTTLLGTALAFFVGFSNNQAYDRWWEARIIWGALVNDSRSFARYVLHNIFDSQSLTQEQKNIQKGFIQRHIAFVYALKSALRETDPDAYKQYLSPEDLHYVINKLHLPNAILELQAIKLNQLRKDGIIDSFMYYQLNQFIINFTEHLGRSERIKSTIFPISYIYFTKLFIWVLVIFVQLNFNRSFGFWSVVLSSVIGFIFHITHQNGMSLMNPFNNHPAGIALDTITRTIERNLLEMNNAEEIPPPIEAVNREYIM